MDGEGGRERRRAHATVGYDAKYGNGVENSSDRAERGTSWVSAMQRQPAWAVAGANKVCSRWWNARREKNKHEQCICISPESGDRHYMQTQGKMSCAPRGQHSRRCFKFQLGMPICGTFCDWAEVSCFRLRFSALTQP